MAYNQSRIKQFRRCQRQYSFRYDTVPGKELVPKRTRVQLRRGSWMHALLEAHHRSWAGLDADWEEVHEAWTQRFNRLFDEEKEELGDLPGECERMFRAYLRRWKDDSDRYRVATLNGGSPAVECALEVSLSRWGIVEPFKGTADLLVTDQEYEGLWIWDHKWVRSIPAVDERMMSPQALLYAWALRQMGHDIRGFVYNYGRTKAPTIPPQLINGGLSVAKKIDTDFTTYLQAIRRAHPRDWKFQARTRYKDMLLQLKRRDTLWFRRERIPVDQARIAQAVREFIVTARDIERRNLKYPPRTYLYTCPRWCDYHDLCVADFQGLDIAPLLKANYTTQDERYHDPEEDLLGG